MYFNVLLEKLTIVGTLNFYWCALDSHTGPS